MDHAAQIARLEHRLARERNARLQAEAIAERGLRSAFIAQQQVDLLQTVSSAAADGSALTTVLEVALCGIGAVYEWPLGHVFLVEDGVLHSTGIWHGSNQGQLQPMRAATNRILFDPESLPGRVVRSGKPAWVRDIALDGNFQRLAAARGCGLRGAAAFPVLVYGRAVAVLEYFGPDVFEPDAEQQDLIQRVLLKISMVAEREETQASLAQAQAQLAAALGNMSQGLCMFDRAQRLVLCNDRFVSIYAQPGGTQPAPPPPGTTLRALLDTQCESGICPEDSADFLNRRLALSAAGEPANDCLLLRDGRVLAIAYRPMPAGGWVETHEDITEQQRTQARLAYLAHHDALTTLPNRLLFHDRLSQALTAARRTDGAMALLCLDLDRFKEVNDTLGHKAGDELLQRVAQRLRRCARETDTVARLGGDEFAIVQTGNAQPAAATAFAQRLLEELALPYDLLGHRIFAGASIGIAIGPQDGADADTLMRNADLAMYRSKSSGRACYSFFEPGLHAAMQARLALETDLRAALAQDQFDLYYQPIVDSRSRAVRGFEALLRWHHPQRGMVSPGEFIPMAEELGLIGALGHWVLRRACRDAAAWADPVTVAVNLSSLQFRGDLVREVAAALHESGLPPQRLELEITESVLIADAQSTLQILRALKETGVRIAMDDFGTGYSSLSYLLQFPFDRVKIDRAFVADLSERADSATIVHAVVELCHSLGMATTAEGVETEAQLAKIGGTRPISVQGYLFGRPAPAASVNALLQLRNQPA